MKKYTLICSLFILLSCKKEMLNETVKTKNDSLTLINKKLEKIIELGGQNDSLKKIIELENLNKLKNVNDTIKPLIQKTENGKNYNLIINDLNNLSKQINMQDQSFSFDRNTSKIGISEYEFPLYRVQFYLDSGQWSTGEPCYLLYIKCNESDKCVYDYARNKFEEGASVAFNTRYDVKEFINLLNQLKKISKNGTRNIR